MTFREVNDDWLCWMEECYWMPLRPLTCTERRGERLCVSCKRGAPPPKKSVNTRDLGPNSGQFRKSLISELEKGRTRVITCPGVLRVSPFTSTFLVQLLVALPVYSQKCSDLYSKLHGHTFRQCLRLCHWHALWPQTSHSTSLSFICHTCHTRLLQRLNEAVGSRPWALS